MKWSIERNTSNTDALKINDRKSEKWLDYELFMSTKGELETRVWPSKQNAFNWWFLFQTLIELIWIISQELFNYFLVKCSNA